MSGVWVELEPIEARHRYAVDMVNGSVLIEEATGRPVSAVDLAKACGASARDVPALVGEVRRLRDLLATARRLAVTDDGTGTHLTTDALLDVLTEGARP